jgi:hypothetical protein
MTSALDQRDTSADTAAAVLVAARAERATADTAELRLLRLAVDWAAMHSVDSIHEAATFPRVCSGDIPFPVAGPGAPLVAEFCVAEFASAVGLPTEFGKLYVGEAVELRYRLPEVWARVMAGDLAAWRARRIARATIALSPEAAGFVDAQVAGFAHKVRPSQVDRLVEEAVTRFMPAEAKRRRLAAADGRHVGVHTGQVSFEGTVWVEGQLDLADGLDLDAALGTRAATLATLGSEESLDVRRSLALGDLARRQLTLDLDTDQTDEAGAERAGQPARPQRQVILYLHLAADAVTSREPDLHPLRLGRVENTGSFVDADQIKTWCGARDTAVVVKPVIDLADHVHVGAYEVPGRLVEQATLVDLHCVFPWCTRPARRLRPDDHGTDCDHVLEHDRGGTTCSCNIAPLCRRHHRLKTHTAWGYTVLERGTYLWTSPHRYQFLRDHTGTLDVSADRRTAPAPAHVHTHPPDEPDR